MSSSTPRARVSHQLAEAAEASAAALRVDRVADTPPAHSVRASGQRSATTGLSPRTTASFLTPIATPANMMVMGPGGYRFGDYWKLGLPTMASWLVTAVVVIPIVWPF
jgi:hypothetical protein